MDIYFWIMIKIISIKLNKFYTLIIIIVYILLYSHLCLYFSSSRQVARYSNCYWNSIH